MDYYDNSMELRKAINQIRDNFFSPTEPGAFQDIVNSLLHHDRYVVIAVHSLPNVNFFARQSLKSRAKSICQNIIIATKVVRL